jgi:phosphoribosylamine---glycine ligase
MVRKLQKVVVIGKSARLHATVEALLRSSDSIEVYVISDVRIAELAAPDRLFVGKSDDVAFVQECVVKIGPDLAVIGPEEPLATGVADALWQMGVPCVGPVKRLAKLETSKSFTRNLLNKYNIPGNIEYMVFYSMEGIAQYVRKLGDFVIKPDGLTGGKGVRVSGEHLSSIADALKYCEELFSAGQPAVVVEEKLDGEEFSYQSFFDGHHIAHTIPVQDHKRARESDTGPNTGGMGSYSCADHSLPFLPQEEIRQAGEINRLVGEALLKETGQEYKGVLYGGFMITAKGLRVIEYNARFGDPEVMNILPIMQTNFLDVCEAIISGTLDRLPVRFENKATVCKYVVPDGYPEYPCANTQVGIEQVNEMRSTEPNLRIYLGAVEGDGTPYRLTGSRAIALVGIGPTLREAEAIAEKAASLVVGPLYHRKDIGTDSLIQKRIDHAARLRLASEQQQPKIKIAS